MRPDANDVTERPRIWRRFGGDDWAAFDALPPAVRHRLHEHAYDAWTVNALILWKMFRRQTASSARGVARLLNHLRVCERLELEAFACAYSRRWGGSLPHLAAGASTLRYAMRGMKAIGPNLDQPAGGLDHGRPHGGEPGRAPLV